MISNENAERIGRPIIESVVKAHVESDYGGEIRTLGLLFDR